MAKMIDVTNETEIVQEDQLTTKQIKKTILRRKMKTKKTLVTSLSMRRVSRFMARRRKEKPSTLTRKY